DALRNLDDSEMLTLRAEDPDALRPREPDAAALVALHPVDEIPFLQARGADVLGEHAPVCERAVALDVEDADVRPVGVVDVEEGLVGREAQAVRLAKVVDEELRVAASGRDPVDALEVEL